MGGLFVVIMRPRVGESDPLVSYYYASTPNCGVYLKYVTHGFKNFATRAKLTRWLYHARRIMLIYLLTVCRVAISTRKLVILTSSYLGLKFKVYFGL